MFEDDSFGIKNTCEKQGIQLIIMFYGTDLQLKDNKLRWPQKWLAEDCRQNNIYFLDLLPAFEGFSVDKILIGQGHPSSFGNNLLAGHLFNFLEKNKLLN